MICAPDVNLIAANRLSYGERSTMADVLCSSYVSRGSARHMPLKFWITVPQSEGFENVSNILTYPEDGSSTFFWNNSNLYSATYL
jgi:hypothetical protein